MTTYLHVHATKDWVRGELRREGPASVIGRADLSLDEALELVDAYPKDFIPIGATCDNRGPDGRCLGHVTAASENL